MFSDSGGMSKRCWPGCGVLDVLELLPVVIVVGREKAEAWCCEGPPREVGATAVTPPSGTAEAEAGRKGRKALLTAGAAPEGLMKAEGTEAVPELALLGGGRGGKEVGGHAT